MHLAIYFPGGYGPGQDPFFAGFSQVTIRALEQADAFVLPVHYDELRPLEPAAASLQPNRERFESGIRREVRGALAHYQPERVTMVGKSRGNHALRLLCSEAFPLPEDTRMIWLTPSWRSDESWKVARSNTIPSLHVVGLADTDYHLPDRHRSVAGETVEIPNADHDLQVAGDILATLDAWRTLAGAIVRFAARDERDLNAAEAAIGPPTSER